MSDTTIEELLQGATIDADETKEITMDGEIVYNSALIPEGLIVMYDGHPDNLGSDWTLCDGNSAPDLQGRFPKSIPDTNTEPGKTGGNNSVVCKPHGHTHTWSGRSSAGGGGNPSASRYPSGGSQTTSKYSTRRINENHDDRMMDSLPPYYDLHFVQATADTDDVENKITIWGKPLADIPSGWTLCDGSGAPSLSNRFVQGATTNDRVGNTGGSRRKEYTHNHPLFSSASEFDGERYYLRDYSPGRTQATSAVFEWLPPYHDLGYIKYDAAESVPSGTIAIWAGSLSTIPRGWVVCDGNNGTPDLRDRFPRAVTSSPGGRGGQRGPFESEPHDHSGSAHTADAAVPFRESGTYYSEGGSVDSTTETVMTKSDQEHDPPYYEVAFIMKR